MKFSKSIATLIFVASFLTTAAEIPNDDPGLDASILQSGQINASETILLNITIGSNLSSVSFILVWANSSSNLDEVLTTPSKIVIDSSAQPPIIYASNNSMKYYIVPEPEPGNWTEKITAKNVPPAGEKYWVILDKNAKEELMVEENLSQEQNATNDCLDCTNEG